MSGWMIAELHLLGTAVLAGILFRACYDFWLIGRELWHPGELIAGIGDVLYWLGGCMFTFRMLYYANDGIIRGFVLVGMFVGMLLYHCLVSGIVVRIICGLCRKIAHIWNKYIVETFIKIIRRKKKFLSKNVEKREEMG